MLENIHERQLACKQTIWGGSKAEICPIALT